MRTVLITGASSGIGEATARLLATSGWRVFGGVRNEDEVSLPTGVGSVRLDVTSTESITRAKDLVEQRTAGRLDALVNNAGIPVAGAVETIPVDDFRELIETNLIGSFAVTKSFLPLIRAATGRIVFVGSLGGRVAFPYASAYHASKFGIEGFAESLRAEMRPLGVDVSVIEPASMQTEIWGKGREQLSRVRESLTPDESHVYGEALAAFDERLASADSSGGDPADVAQKIEEALTEANPDDRYLVGRGAGTLTLLETVLPPSFFDRIKHRFAGQLTG